MSLQDLLVSPNVHVKYHAKRALDCEDKPLLAKCSAEYKSGECYEFEVTGCDTKVTYRNVPSVGWTQEF